MKNKKIIVLIFCLLLITGIGIYFFNKKDDSHYIDHNSSKTSIIKEIVDKSKDIEDFTCAESLDDFYEDEEYVYSYNCLKSQYIVVKYLDNTEETVAEGLKNKKITISDLDKHGINYYKTSKEQVLEDKLIFTIKSATLDSNCAMPVELSLYNDFTYIIYNSYKDNNNVNKYTNKVTGIYDYDIDKIIEKFIDADQRTYTVTTYPEYEVYTNEGLKYVVENTSRNEPLEELLQQLNIDLHQCAKKV